MKPAMMLLATSTTLLISGCCPKCPQPNTVYVPQKCVIPDTEYPDIDNTKYDDNASIIKKALNNYTKMKEYAEKLKANSEICR